jgi:hypothetical protein
VSRPRGGYIGHYATPAASGVSSQASGVWTLREAESLKRAGTWPTVPEQGSPPATPTGLAQTACDTDTGTGTIAWNNVAGATSYVLEWSFSPGGPYTEAFSGAGNSTNLDVEGFGGSAYYRVKAVNADGSSAWSDEVYAVCAIG